MVLRPGGVGAVGGDAYTHAAIAEHLAVQGLQQPGLPAVGHFDDRRRAAKLDPADPLSIEPADAIEEVQDLGLAGAAGQGFNVQKRHDGIVCRARRPNKASNLREKRNVGALASPRHGR